jgi:hypothetical protein
MIQYQLFPKYRQLTPEMKSVVSVFEKNSQSIKSDTNELISNDVLFTLKSDLEAIGFNIEKSKKKNDKIKIPVLFGRNGKLEKSFDADGLDVNSRTVIEIEAGRAVSNYQFLKDLFQACMMQEIDNLIIAVRNSYKGKPDFEVVVTFFDTLYASGRLNLPLHRILIIGY